MKFNYKKLAFGLIRPIIPIEIRHQGESVRYEALVDSGADMSILSAEIAVALGIDVASGQEATFVGATGVPESSYIHEVGIAIDGRIVIIEVMFTEKVGQEGYGVLGQLGFFEHYKVAFDYRKEQVQLTPQP